VAADDQGLETVVEVAVKTVVPVEAPTANPTVTEGKLVVNPTNLPKTHVRGSVVAKQTAAISRPKAVSKAAAPTE
jgi:hypothetical protein